MVTLERCWFGLLFTLLVAEQAFAQHPLLRLGRWRLVNYLGVISYGLYCYHGLTLTLATKLAEGNGIVAGMPGSLLTAVVFLFTTFVAAASYRYFEQPFLSLKKKFYPAA
jgi:peptidoglycan/LPS O-acetylase OafA/YrhL